MAGTDKGGGKAEAYVSPYLMNTPRILRDACRAMLRDKGGRLCPLCELRDFCEAQARRADEFAGACAD